MKLRRVCLGYDHFQLEVPNWIPDELVRIKYDLVVVNTPVMDTRAPQTWGRETNNSSEATASKVLV